MDLNNPTQQKKDKNKTSTLVTDTQAQNNVTPPPQATGIGGQNVATPTTDQQRRGSGLFTNVRAYLDANKGAGQQLAQGIESGAQKEAQRFTSGVQEAQGTVSKIEDIKNRLAQANTYAQQIQQNPTQALKNLEDIQALRTGVYGSQLDEQGGAASQRLADISRQSQEVQRLAEQANTEGGRFGLLEQTYGSPQYSEGAKRLDQLFLQAEGGNTLGNLQKSLAAVGSSAAQQQREIEERLGASLDAARGLVPEAQEQIKSTIGSFDEAGGGALGDIYSDLTTRQQQEQARQEDLLARARKQFERGTFDQEVADALGLAGQRIYDVNLADYAKNIRGTDDVVTLADVASQEQQSRLDALRQLGGFGDEYNPQFNLGAREGSVGLDFDADAFNAAVQDAENRYVEARKAAIGRDINQGDLESAYGDNLATALSNKSYADLMALEEGRQSASDLFAGQIATFDEPIANVQSQIDALNNQIESASRLQQERDSWRQAVQDRNNLQAQLNDLQNQRAQYENFNIGSNDLLAQTLAALRNRYGANRTFSIGDVTESPSLNI